MSEKYIFNVAYKNVKLTVQSLALERLLAGISEAELRHS